MSPDDPRHGSTTGYRLGCREACCRRAMASAEMRRRNRRYLERLDSLRVPNVGTKRRVQALVALGWSMSEISREAGYDRSHLPLMLRRSGPLHIDTAKRIAGVYDRLSMKLPPEETKEQKISASRARNMARRNGWAPPLAWDDIDRPDATPDFGDVELDILGRVAKRGPAIENAQWMADADENLTAVCERLNLAPETFYQTCRRAGRLDLYATLSRRDVDGEMAMTIRKIKGAA